MSEGILAGCPCRCLCKGSNNKVKTKSSCKGSNSIPSLLSRPLPLLQVQMRPRRNQMRGALLPRRIAAVLQALMHRPLSPLPCVHFWCRRGCPPPLAGSSRARFPPQGPARPLVKLQPRLMASAMTSAPRQPRRLMHLVSQVRCPAAKVWSSSQASRQGHSLPPGYHSCASPESANPKSSEGCQWCNQAKPPPPSLQTPADMPIANQSYAGPESII